MASVLRAKGVIGFGRACALWEVVGDVLYLNGASAWFGIATWCLHGGGILLVGNGT